jgi:hypothetical protein
MTKRKSKSSGVHLFTAELTRIKEWLDSDLMMTATSVKIIVSNGNGIGQRVDAIALDEKNEEIAKIDVTDYEAW